MPDTPLTTRDQRNLAETEMFKAQAKYYLAEQQLKTAQAQRQRAEALSAEHHAETARIAAESALRQEKINLTGNHHHREFWFNDGVDETSVAECASQLAIWHRLDPECDMTVKINSPGGDLFEGCSLFDDVSAYSLREWDTREFYPKGSHKTTIIGRGMTASMAGILLQAFDTRVIGPECWVLIHEIHTFSMGKLNEIREDVKFYDRIADRVVDTFVRRSGGKISKSSFKRRWDGKEWWLSSEEALALGFVDAIG